MEDISAPEIIYTILIRTVEKMCLRRRDRVSVYEHGQPSEMGFSSLQHVPIAFKKMH